MERATRRPSLRTCSLAASGLLLTAACAAHTPLEAEVPADAQAETSTQAALDDSLVSEVAGVIVGAHVDDWGGDADVFEYVTPIRFQFDNESGAKLRIRYQDFELKAADGSTYHPLPLYEIGGTPDDPIIVSDWVYAPAYQPGFLLAPFTAGVYAGESIAYDGEWDYEPGYYDLYYPLWAELPGPTPYMIERSLPEGVLGDGEHVTGWLYFQRVPDRPELEPIMLTIALVDAASGEPLGEIRMPFSVR